MIIGFMEQGLAYAVLALGVYITYTILDFPDLSVEGTFPLGAAITVMCVKSGINPILAMLLSLFGGAIAGLITGIIHVKFHVRDLLSGIITMTGLWSINLIIVNNTPNITINPIKEVTIFINNPVINTVKGFSGVYFRLIILLIIVVAVKLILDFFLKTKAGYLLRASGDNPMVVTSLAKDSGLVKIEGLIISNALVALSGSVMCQLQRAFYITMGTGTIVLGLASVIIGINLFRRLSFVKATSAVIVGSCLYQACVSIAIAKLENSAIYMKLIISLLFLGILLISDNAFIAKFKGKRREASRL